MKFNDEAVTKDISKYFLLQKKIQKTNVHKVCLQTKHEVRMWHNVFTLELTLLDKQYDVIQQLTANHIMQKLKVMREIVKSSNVNEQIWICNEIFSWIHPDELGHNIHQLVLQNAYMACLSRPPMINLPLINISRQQVNQCIFKFQRSRVLEFWHPRCLFTKLVIDLNQNSRQNIRIYHFVNSAEFYSDADAHRVLGVRRLEYFDFAATDQQVLNFQPIRYPAALKYDTLLHRFAWQNHSRRHLDFTLHSFEHGISYNMDSY